MICFRSMLLNSSIDTMKRTSLLLGIISVLLAGCAAKGPAFVPVQISDPDTATVYIYRRNNSVLRARAAYFYVNDVNVFDLRAAGYSWIALPAGKYTLRQAWGADMLLAKPIVAHLEVRPGQTRYYSFQTGLCEGGYAHVCLEWEIREETSDVGSREIQKMKFQNNFGAAKLAQQLRSTTSK